VWVRESVLGVWVKGCGLGVWVKDCGLGVSSAGCWAALRWWQAPWQDPCDSSAASLPEAWP
jgi:hypothetical protein